MEAKGTLVTKFETQIITDSFKKREFVIEYAENPEYPEYIKFELIQDKCVLLDSYTEGQEITVSFNLKGRKWTDPQGVVKFFNTLQAWKIFAHSEANRPEPKGIIAEMEQGNEGVNDLPF